MMDANDKVHMTGFDLPQEEMSQLHAAISHPIKKLREKTDFDVLELNLKKSSKGKVFNHQVRGRVHTRGKVLSAEDSDYNVFKAVSLVLEKILHEAEHLQRTSRQLP